MKKVVILKVYLPDDRAKQKAMKAVSSLAGVVSTDMGKDQKLTVTGDMDTVDLVRKLRKLCSTEILSVEEPKNNKKEKEPLKEEPNKEKETEKEEPKKEKETEKEEPKKENESEKEEPKEDKKEKEPLKEEPKKEKETQKEEPKKDEMAELVKAYEAYNPYMAQTYFLTSAEENPNACAIC